MQTETFDFEDKFDMLKNFSLHRFLKGFLLFIKLFMYNNANQIKNK